MSSLSRFRSTLDIPHRELDPRGRGCRRGDAARARGLHALIVHAGIVAHAAAAVKPAGECLRLEFSIAPQATDAALTTTGLLIVNPPWTLQGELKIILAELEKPLGQGGAGRFRLEVPKP